MADSSRPERRFLALLFGLLSVSYFAFGGYRNWPYKIESDGKYFYQYLVSAVSDGDLDFTNQYRLPKYPWMMLEVDHYRFQDRVSPRTGRPVNIFWPGTALLWLPFYAAARALGALLDAAGLAVDVSPFGRFCQYGVMLAGPVFTVCALAVLGRLLSRLGTVSAASSRLALALLLFASPLYYYAVFEPSMSHVYDLAVFAAYLVAVLRWRERGGWKEVAAVALAGGLFILVRAQNAATVGLFSLVLFFLPEGGGPAGERAPARRLERLLACALPLALGVLPILALNRYLNGGAFVVEGAGGSLAPFHAKVLEVLFSARNGLFSHHPLLLAGLAGFVWLLASPPAGLPRWFLGTLFGSFVVQVWVNASTHDWWGGDAFGQRRLLSSLPLFALGLAFLLEKVRQRAGGRFTRPVLAASAAAMALGFYLTLIHVFFWSYQEPHDVLRWMFVTAPSRIAEELRAGPAG